MRTFDSYLTEIMDEFTSKAYEAELKKAKQEFFETTGPVHEDDAFYETYMTAFIEWYLFDRDLKNQDLPPVRLFYRNHLKQLSEDRAGRCWWFGNTRSPVTPRVQSVGLSPSSSERIS